MTDKQNNCKYFDKETGAKMVETFRWYRKVLGLDKEKIKEKGKTMTDKEYMLKRKFCISSKDNKGFNIAAEFNELNYKEELEQYQEKIRTRLIDIRSRILDLEIDIADLSNYVQSGTFYNCIEELTNDR